MALFRCAVHKWWNINIIVAYRIPVSFAKEPCLQSYCSYLSTGPGEKYARNPGQVLWFRSSNLDSHYATDSKHDLTTVIYYDYLYLFQEAPKLKEQL